MSEANYPQQRDYRKAFGQFSSIKTQRINTLKSVEVLLDAQEEIETGTHSIDFDVPISK